MRDRRRAGGQRLHDCRIFYLDRVRFESAGGEPAGEYYVVEAPEWINVVPVTEDGRVVLVRQYRYGIEAPTLEIPGGMCDPGESPIEAARRELREETGYDARELVSLGWVHPNPAVQTNRCHSFLARGAFVAGDPEPDEDEEIEVETVPLASIPDLIREGAITHSLVIAAFHLLSLRREGE